MAMPKWAESLLLDAACYWESKGNDVVLPDVQWRRCRRQYSSGAAFTHQRRMGINAGKDRFDAKLVLLHEYAHILAPPDDHHSARFWDIAWELFRWAKLPIRKTLKRSGNYRKGAIAAYHRSKPE